MIITDRDAKTTYLESIIDSQNPMLIGISKNKQVVFQNHWQTDVYLAYYCGNWYASNDDEKGGSKYRRTEPHTFFAYGDGIYLEPKGRGKAEVATSGIALSEETHSYLLVYYNKQIGIVVADGSRSESIIMEAFSATHSLWKLLLLSLCSMIRQHDSTAADEIEAFFEIRTKEPTIDRKSKDIRPNVIE